MLYFVTAIGTDSGKTLVSAVLTEMLHADYWKPVQSGLPRDTETVQSLVSNKHSQFYNERYLLNTPASPHAAAEIDGVEIQLKDVVPPVSNRDLIIEGAGGLLVPLNRRDTMLDLILSLEVETVLVSNLYLGSINHTLLTIEVLQKNKVPLKGIIFNGEENKSSREIILEKSGLDQIMHIPKLKTVDKDVISGLADQLKESWI